MHPWIKYPKEVRSQWRVQRNRSCHSDIQSLGQTFISSCHFPVFSGCVRFSVFHFPVVSYHHHALPQNTELQLVCQVCPSSLNSSSYSISCDKNKNADDQHRLEKCDRIYTVFNHVFWKYRNRIRHTRAQ